MGGIQGPNLTLGLSESLTCPAPPAAQRVHPSVHRSLILSGFVPAWTWKSFVLYPVERPCFQRGHPSFLASAASTRPHPHPFPQSFHLFIYSSIRIFIYSSIHLFIYCHLWGRFDSGAVPFFVFIKARNARLLTTRSVGNMHRTHVLLSCGSQRSPCIISCSRTVTLWVRDCHFPT